MALWKRGRRYWTQVMIHGVRIRRPLCPPGSNRATTKWQEAIQLEKDLIRAALEGKLGAHSAPTRLFDGCEKYLAAKEATANTKRAVEFDRERLEVVKRYLAEGAGVSFLPEGILTPSDTGLRALEMPDLPEIVIGALWRSDTPLSRAAGVFLETLGGALPGQRG